ncbi:unnamed protein product [Vitrella brassicaformis CCMP3155]|uniref:RAP domain-containing protein n=3 Tax=Vitrella brassicaformis TaxID=1169539 RepID=A0A0G4EUT2_VITBC|nr:unnamed protein product [Vitrella brassicaformis CCMP3155]|eukprot:CEM02214.1 unnamed protein product [Vitrella brassicaformis CCMP3155]
MGAFSVFPLLFFLAHAFRSEAFTIIRPPAGAAQLPMRASYSAAAAATASPTVSLPEATRHRCSMQKVTWCQCHTWSDLMQLLEEHRHQLSRIPLHSAVEALHRAAELANSPRSGVHAAVLDELRWRAEGGLREAPNAEILAKAVWAFNRLGWDVSGLLTLAQEPKCVSTLTHRSAVDLLTAMAEARRKRRPGPAPRTYPLLTYVASHSSTMVSMHVTKAMWAVSELMRGAGGGQETYAEVLASLADRMVVLISRDQCRRLPQSVATALMALGSCGVLHVPLSRSILSLVRRRRVISSFAQRDLRETAIGIAKLSDLIPHPSDLWQPIFQALHSLIDEVNERQDGGVDVRTMANVAWAASHVYRRGEGTGREAGRAVGTLMQWLVDELEGGRSFNGQDLAHSAIAIRWFHGDDAYPSLGLIADRALLAIDRLSPRSLTTLARILTLPHGPAAMPPPSYFMAIECFQKAALQQVEDHLMAFDSRDMVALLKAHVPGRHTERALFLVNEHMGARQQTWLNRSLPGLVRLVASVGQGRSEETRRAVDMVKWKVVHHLAELDVPVCVHLLNELSHLWGYAHAADTSTDRDEYTSVARGCPPKHVVVHLLAMKVAEGADRLTTRELSLTFGSVARLHYGHPAVTQPLMVALSSILDHTQEGTFDDAGLAGVLWALGRLHFHDDRLLPQLLTLVPSVMAICCPLSAVLALHGLSGLLDDTAVQDEQAQLAIDTLISRLTPSVESLAPEWISSIMWSLGRLHHHPSGGFLSAIEKRTVTEMGQWPHQTLACVAWGFSRLQWGDKGELWRLLVQEATGRVESMNGREVADVVQAFEAADVLTEDFTRAVRAWVRRHVRESDKEGGSSLPVRLGDLCSLQSVVDIDALPGPLGGGLSVWRLPYKHLHDPSLLDDEYLVWLVGQLPRSPLRRCSELGDLLVWEVAARAAEWPLERLREALEHLYKLHVSDDRLIEPLRQSLLSRLHCESIPLPTLMSIVRSLAALTQRTADRAALHSPPPAPIHGGPSERLGRPPVAAHNETAQSALHDALVERVADEMERVSPSEASRLLLGVSTLVHRDHPDDSALPPMSEGEKSTQLPTRLPRKFALRLPAGSSSGDSSQQIERGHLASSVRRWLAQEKVVTSLTWEDLASIGTALNRLRWRDDVMYGVLTNEVARRRLAVDNDGSADGRWEAIMSLAWWGAGVKGRREDCAVV